jgi:hypothetical protein
MGQVQPRRPPRRRQAWAANSAIPEPSSASVPGSGSAVLPSVTLVTAGWASKIPPMSCMKRLVISSPGPVASNP